VSVQLTSPSGYLEKSLHGFAMTKQSSILRFITVYFSNVFVKGRLKLGSRFHGRSIIGKDEFGRTPSTGTLLAGP
jgi:hypothetical protein